MTKFKIIIFDKSYSNWTIYDNDTNEIMLSNDFIFSNDFVLSKETDFSPFKHKLFSDDVFTINNSNNSINIIYSSLRHNHNIPAILILKDNLTYGREKDKLLYKCIPHNKQLPTFMVPFHIKQLGFSKIINNIYVTIHFNHWNDKHPHAHISQILGSTDSLPNFYEYQLFCKNINISIQQFNKQTSKIIQNSSFSFNNLLFINKQIQDRRMLPIFTIDPEHSLDFDDAFGIQIINKDKQLILLSIYISNVPILIESLHLWNFFSKRVSTIYLPNKIKTMLPTLLSDDLCSLKQNNDRIAFTMDITLDESFNIVSISFSNALIKVYKNYIYDEPNLLNDNNYKFLYDTAINMLNNYKYINNITNSHELVAYLMIFMNYHCAINLFKHNNGIFRSVIKNYHNKETLSINFIKLLYSSENSSFSSGQYLSLNNDNLHSKEQFKHDCLGLDKYVHITSPIRRIVDVLNMIQIQINNKLFDFSYDAIYFYNSWISDIHFINKSMKHIKKIQNDANLLNLVFNNDNIINELFQGTCIDKKIINEYQFNYTIYLPKLKLFSNIKTSDILELYKEYYFKLFLFTNEETTKKKIKLQRIVC